MAHVTDTTHSALDHTRFSWGAIFAGVAMAFVVHILLSVLGLAIGVSTIDPLQEGNPVAGIGLGAGIYTIVIALISLFVGGFTAGSLSASQDTRTRTLHGLTTWAVVTIVTFMLLTTIVGRLIGGTAHLVATGMEQVGKAASAVMEPVMEEAREQISEVDLDIDMAAIRREARALLQETESPELQPRQVEQEVETIANRAAQTAEQVAKNPQAANEEIQGIFDRIQSEMREKMSAADREAMINVLASRTDMTETQAQEAVNSWEQTYQEAYRVARKEFEAIREEAEQTARQWGESAAEAVATAAWWTFLLLLLNAIAAAIGANVGANRREVVVSTR